jgi:hypothetical protein
MFAMISLSAVVGGGFCRTCAFQKCIQASYQFRQFARKRFTDRDKDRAPTTSALTTISSTPSALSVIESDKNHKLPKRNKKFASVIRDGLAQLNETSLYIQNSKHCNLPLAHLGHRGPIPKSIAQISEERQLLSLAQECLEELVLKRPQSGLALNGEPIHLLVMDVKSSFAMAVLYYTLPISILTNERLTVDIRKALTNKLHDRVVVEQGQLQYMVSSRLRSRRSPPIRLEPASDDMLFEHLHDALGTSGQQW